MMKMFISKRSRLSSEPTSFHSDIVAKLHQAEVATESSSCKRHQRPGKSHVVSLPDKQYQHDPDEQAALNNHLDHIGVEIPRAFETSPEDPEEEEDPDEEEEYPEEFPANV
ncbi:hypothetical protein FNV43_RR00409 [Rhamnella rubrinervis]|uniref:Uncharacterized protein n=1 Tax=Rhamnella rubrinervis TaxID=2594499 RepID=A0A8K0MRD6_9ROSA|nr:hypothetical protein FNV43_RR00409 [Rhamnella rubrinervis]